MFKAVLSTFVLAACCLPSASAGDPDTEARAALALANVSKPKTPVKPEVPATPNGCTCADGSSECICTGEQQCPGDVCPITTTGTPVASAPAKNCVTYQHSNGKTYNLEYGKSYQFPDCVVTVGYPTYSGQCSGGQCGAYGGCASGCGS